MPVDTDPIQNAPLYRLAQIHLNNSGHKGPLDQYLRDRRQAGLTYLDLVKQFEALGLRLTNETMRRWCLRVGATAPDHEKTGQQPAVADTH